MVLEWLPVPDAGALFGQFQEELAADHLRKGLQEEDAVDNALHNIRDMIREQGLPLDTYSLPEPRSSGRRDWGAFKLERELAYDVEHEQKEFDKLFTLIEACPEQLPSCCGADKSLCCAFSAFSCFSTPSFGEHVAFLILCKPPLRICFTMASTFIIF